MTAQPSEQRPAEVGFVGLGNLGGAMVTALVRAGWTVRAYDVRPEAVRACVEAGALSVEGPDQLADCAVIALAVPDDNIAGETVETLLDAGSTGVVVAHSTLLPETAQRLAERIRQAGGDFVDAPVSGGAERAAEGTLAVMVGADDSAYASASSYLDTVGSDVRRLGAPGAGSATKLAHQLMMFASLAGAHEAFALAGAYGVTVDGVRGVAESGLADSWISRNWGFFDQIAAAYDDSGLPVRFRPWSKDLWDVVAAARSAEVSVPVAGLLAQHLAGVVEDHARRTREAGADPAAASGAGPAGGRGDPAYGEDAGEEGAQR